MMQADEAQFLHAYFLKLHIFAVVKTYIAFQQPISVCLFVSFSNVNSGLSPSCSCSPS